MGNSISFKKEFGLILVGAIIFTASYLWKDLLLDIEERYFPKHFGLLWRAVYTILVTIILVLLAIHLKNQFGLNSNTSGKAAIEFDDGPIRDASTPDTSDNITMDPTGLDSISLDSHE
ncbi:hypothetical protein QJ854_gp192 [Moumouvirus goulette]|uniref:Uncharacterized protein n=1 Tax=Moumouvirus goulette TaxID=1247379 RepID=M1NNF5_9VIRU|nr:hypothetical protein QJ854_gp192 [Moumouvirus goulette]AGF85590.1 hypothetical protein glt_00785 [Moumouvirus goulette]